MGITEISFPRYVYQQDAQPTGAITGALWVDTNASPITTYVYDGSNWNSLSTDVDWIGSVINEMGINVLINSAAAGSTLNDWDEMEVDNITDADGTSNTIDTGNTTSTFSTNQYLNLAAGVTDAHTTSLSSTASDTNKCGMGITTNTECQLIKVTKDATSTATHAYLLDSSFSQLASAAFAGNDATFAYLLSNATLYYVVVDKETASYTRAYNNGGSMPESDTNIDWTSGCYNGAGSGNQCFNVVSVQTQAPAAKIIQTNVISVTTGQTHHQVYSKNAGSGTLTYDISFDNGAHYDTGQSLNTKNTRTAATGTQMILKINQPTGSLSKVKNYGVLLYY